MGAPAILHHPPAGSTPGRFATTVEMDATATSAALEAADDEGHAEAYVAYELTGVRRGFTLTPPDPAAGFRPRIATPTRVNARRLVRQTGQVDAMVAADQRCGSRAMATI